jgi:hypothetical protein
LYLRAIKEELDNNSDLTKTLLSGKLAMEEQVGITQLRVC